MTLGILVIVVPIITALFVLNIVDGLEYWNDPYDYDLIHYGPDPFNINFISFTTSQVVRFVDMNINYIPTLTAIVIFFVFGTTTEALNDYRKMLLCFGLGYIFPKLRQEYVPDTRRSGRRSWLSSLSRIFPVRGSTKTTRSSSSFFTRKVSLLPTSVHVSNANRSGASQHEKNHNATDTCTSAVSSTNTNPWPDLSEQNDAVVPTFHPRPPTRNPWVLRTTLNLPHIRLPSISFPSIGKKKTTSEKTPEESLPRFAPSSPHIPSIPGLRKTITPEKEPTAGKVAPLATVDTAISEVPRVWNGSQVTDYPRVNTRVWSADDALYTGETKSGSSSPRRDWVFGSSSVHRRKDRHGIGREHGNHEVGKGDSGNESETELSPGVVKVETETRVAIARDESPPFPSSSVMVDPSAGRA